MRLILLAPVVVVVDIIDVVVLVNDEGKGFGRVELIVSLFFFNLSWWFFVLGCCRMLWV